MKRDNKDIFDIDFNSKSSPATQRKDNNADFFNFSVNNKKSDNDKPHFHEEFAKEETPVEETAPELEVSPSPIEDEAPIVDETPVVEEAPVNDVDPVEEEIPAVVEVPASSEKSPETEIPSPVAISVPEKSNSDIDDDSVSITKVNWHKKTHLNTQLYKKSNASPTAVPSTTPAKKKSLVIETDDGFEIKICNFRDLANK